MPGILSRCSVNICFLPSDRIPLHRGAIRLGIFISVPSLFLEATTEAGRKVLEAGRGQVIQLPVKNVNLQANPLFQRQCLSTTSQPPCLAFVFCVVPPLHKLVSKPVSEILLRGRGWGGGGAGVKHEAWWSVRPSYLLLQPALLSFFPPAHSLTDESI